MTFRSAILLATATLLVAASSVFGAGVEEVIPLGGSTEGRVESGQPHTFGVLVPEGATKVLLKFKLEKNSGLDPDLSVTRPDGTVMNAAALAGAGTKVKLSPKSVLVKNMPVAGTGLYRVTLSGKEGTTGSFQVSSKGKGAKGLKTSGSILGADEVDEFRISVADSTFLSASLKPGKRSALEPRLEIATPSGHPVDLSGFQKVKNGKTSVKNLPLPFFGDYLIRVSRSVGTGEYSLKVKLKAKKIKPDGSLPVADAGDHRIGAPGTVVMIEGSGTPAGAGLDLRWEQVSGPEVALGGPDTATLSFTAPGDKAGLAFQLVATRNGVHSRGSTVVVDVDQPPIAVAGRSRIVAGGAEITLDGGDSFDLDPGETLFHRWTQVSGPPVDLTGADTATPTFTAPASSGTLAFQLVVDDGTAESLPDPILVNVDGSETIADAGRPVVVGLGDTVRLSALRSLTGTGGPPSQFAWEGADAASDEILLTGGNGPVASFSAPRTPGTWRFRLTADGNVATADTVTVVVVRGLENAEPTAAAEGLKTVATGSRFSLFSTGSSDPEGATPATEWMQIEGAPVSLATLADDEMEGTAPGTDDVLLFLLMVHDGLKYGAPDRAGVIVGDAPVPVADAGADRSGSPGNGITLSSAASVAPTGQAIVGYQWVQTSGLDLFDARTDPSFDATAASPGFTIPASVFSLVPDRTITFDLFVTDDTGAKSAADIVTVTLEDLPANAQPEVTANASATIVRPGTSIDLIGTAKDENGDPLTLLWRRTNGSGLITDSGKERASFSVPANATMSDVFIFEFSANDGSGTANAIGSATVTVRVNEAPNVVATVDPPFGPEAAQITLDGSTTTDPDGDTLTYHWEEVDPPGGPVIAPTDAVSANFAVPPYSGTRAARTRRFRLTVTDAVGPVSMDVTFVPNRAPVMNSVTPDKTRIRYDGSEKSTFTASATDPDGDPVTWSWELVSGPSASGGTLTPGSGATASLVVARPTGSNPGTGGVWTVAAMASDGLETSASAVQSSVVASPSFSKDVYTIISSTCATVSCHGGTTAGGLVMNSLSNAYGNLVNKTSSGSPKVRVKPDDASSSFLYEQLSNGVMPKNAGKLPQWQVNMFRDWIEPDGNGGQTGLATGAANN